MRTDKELIEEIKAGKANAFDQLYKAYGHKLYLFVLSILKSKEDAEEVVQNTYLKIWEKRKSIIIHRPVLQPCYPRQKNMQTVIQDR